MEHSSYELSIQLRDAGFPQPELAPGQTWYLDIYDKEWEAAFVCMVEDSLVDVFWIGKREGLLGRDRFLGATYAPTALDILKELGPGYSIGPEMRISAYDEWIGGPVLIEYADEKDALVQLSEAWIDKNHRKNIKAMDENSFLLNPN